MHRQEVSICLGCLCVEVRPAHKLAVQTGLCKLAPDFIITFVSSESFLQAGSSTRRPVPLPAVPATWSAVPGKKLRTKEPAEEEFTIHGLLHDKYEKPKVKLYHMRERLPGFERSHSAEEVSKHKERLAALHAAEALRPSCVGKLEDSEINQHLCTLQPFWQGPLPLITCKGLVQRRSERLMSSRRRDIPGCIEVMWPRVSQDVFQPEEPILASLPMGHEEKVAFAHDFFVSYCLPDMMQNDDASALQELSEAMLQKSTAAPDIMQLEKGKLMVQAVRAVAALVQSMPIRDDQLETWTDQKHSPVLSIAATSRVAKLLQTSVWHKRLDRFWASASSQAMHAPLIHQCFHAFQGEDGEQLDAAWADAERNWTVWSQDLPPETMAFLASAIREHCARQVQKLHSKLLCAEDSQPCAAADATAADMEPWQLPQYLYLSCPPYSAP